MKKIITGILFLSTVAVASAQVWNMTNSQVRGDAYIDTFANRMIAARGEASIWSSTDGTTWSKTDNGLAPVYQYCASLCLFKYDNALLYTAKRVGPATKPSIYSSTNGTNWTLVSEITPGANTNNSNAPNVTSIFRKGANMVCGTGEGMYYSSDTGLTWAASTFASDVSVKSIQRNSIIDLNGTLFASTSRNIIKSTDNGATWSTAFAAPSSTQSYTFSGLIKTNTGLIATFKGSSEGGLYRSLDNGATWTRFNGEATMVNIMREAQNIFYIKGIAFVVATDKYVYQSNDNGTTWHSIQGTWNNLQGNLINGGQRPYGFTIFNSKLYSIGNDGIFTSGAPGNFPNSVAELNELPVLVYPNPANDEVTVSDVPVGARISVLDLTGKTIQTTMAENETSTINTSMMKSGMYFILVESAEGKACKKLVVNR